MRKNKTWLIDLFNTELVMRRQPVTQMQNDEFWTSDTEAYLNFKVSTQEFIIDTAKINLYNKDDGTLVQRDMTKENNEAQYELPQEIIAHFGKWSAQVVFISGTERYTSPMVDFEVRRTLGDDLPEKLGLIQDWKDLNDEVKAFVAEIEGFTLDEFVELKMGEELANLETNYATRLTGLEQKDNQLATQLAQSTSSIRGDRIYKAKIFGHRGMESIAPENTIPAFEYCGERGLYGIETDAQVTSDGVWIVHHDLTVDKMTDGTGNIADMTLADIKALNINALTNVDHYPNLKIPTLEEFLRVCVQYNLMPLIEIKVPSATQYFGDLVDLIKKYNMEDRCSLLVGDTSVIHFRNLSKKLILHLLCSGTKSDVDLMASIGNGAVSVSIANITQEKIDYAHSKGVLFNSWGISGMVNVQNLISMGVDFLTLGGYGVI